MFLRYYHERQCHVIRMTYTQLATIVKEKGSEAPAFFTRDDRRTPARCFFNLELGDVTFPDLIDRLHHGLLGAKSRREPGVRIFELQAVLDFAGRKNPGVESGVFFEWFLAKTVHRL